MIVVCVKFVDCCVCSVLCILCIVCVNVCYTAATRCQPNCGQLENNGSLVLTFMLIISLQYELIITVINP
jgi:hypothetical protein